MSLYDVNERRERKIKAERRRLLEKAKMKGKKNRHAAAATNTAISTTPVVNDEQEQLPTPSPEPSNDPQIASRIEYEGEGKMYPRQESAPKSRKTVAQKAKRQQRQAHVV